MKKKHPESISKSFSDRPNAAAPAADSPVSDQEFLEASSAGGETQRGDILAHVLNQHAIVSVADAKGRITYVNDKCVECSGYSKSELMGNDHRILKSDAHPPEFYAEMWRTIVGGKTWTGEIKNIKKTGEPYWVKATIVPRLDGAGRPVEYVSIRTDISREKAAEETRAQQETFDLSEAEVYMFWADTLRFFYVNKKAQEHWRLDSVEFFQKTPLDVTNEFKKEEFLEVLNSLASGEKKNVIFRRNMTSPEGVKCPVEFRVQLVNPDGRRARFITIIRDMSETLQAEKAKSEFIANMNHELKTPLTTLKGAIDLLKSGYAGDIPEKALNLFRVADRSRIRLEELIGDLLDAQAIENGQTISSLEKVDLSQVIEDAIGVVAGPFKEKDVRVFFFGTEGPVWVIGDRHRLRQAMKNLLSNAVKFSIQRGKVEVSLHVEEETVLVLIKDYGIGMPEEVRSRVFEKFTQADMSDRRASGGAGLGLSIVKAIIEDHGGTIECDSTSGKGTMFSVALKKCQDEEHALKATG